MTVAVVDPVVRELSDGTRVLIRTATLEDAADLLRLGRMIAREGEFVLTTAEEFTLDEPQEREWIASYRDRSDALLLVADVGGEAVGLVNFACQDRKRLCHWGEFGVSVVPRWRDWGVGRMLLEGLLEWAEAHPGVKKVCLSVVETNKRARALYEKLGFREEGRRVRAVRVGDDYIDLLLMYRFTD